MPSFSSISVVIPCYNAAPYLAATLDSVLAQDVAGLDVIVVDDGSSDGSAALVANNYPQVRLLRQSNAGIAAARNSGIAAARGDWVAFIDADDIWLPGKLRAQLEQLQAKPDCRLSYTAWQDWPSQAAGPAPHELAAVAASAADASRWDGASGWIYPQLLLDCVVWTSTVLVQRTLLAEIGGFDTSLRVGEDYDLWLRASRVTPIARVARPYALYRQHPASITRALPDDNYRAQVVSLALARWGLDSPDGQCAGRAAVRRGLAHSWSAHAGAHLQAGNLVRARASAWQALGQRGACLTAWIVLFKAGLRTLAGAPAQATR